MAAIRGIVSSLCQTRLKALRFVHIKSGLYRQNDLNCEYPYQSKRFLTSLKPSLRRVPYCWEQKARVWIQINTHVQCRYLCSVFQRFSDILSHRNQDQESTDINKNRAFASSCVTLEHSLYMQKRQISEDRKTTALTVWSDLVQIKSSPLPALVLGLSGLIPFICAPLYMILSQAYLPTLAFAQTAYGAAILSFLGGVRWGITLPEESVNRPDWKNLSYSVIPSLIASGGLLCAEPVSSITIMTGLAGLAYFDVTMYGYPPWFKALRFLLTIFAVLSLWTTFVCRFLLSSSVKEEKTEIK